MARKASTIARLATALLVSVPTWVAVRADASPPSGTSLSGLVAYWSFDNSATFETADIGGGPLTRGNGASWTASGKFDGALSLNGSSQSLYNTNSPSYLPVGNSSYSQSVWFRPSVVNNGGLMGWGTYGSTKRTNALRMSGSSSGGFYNYWWDVDLYCGPATCPLSTNTWYHVVTTYDGTTRSLYLNGVLKASDANRGPNSATAENFHIGKTCCSEYFTGLIDDVAIYNRALTSAEVSSLASATTTTSTTTSTTTTSTTTTTTTTTSTTIVPTTTAAPATTVTAPATTAAAQLEIVLTAPASSLPAVSVPSTPSTSSSVATSSVVPVVKGVTGPSAPTTTSTSTVPPTAPAAATSTVAPPMVPAMVTGQASVQIAGARTDATISRENNEVIIRSGPVTAALGAVDDSGSVAPLDAQGNIRLKPGAKIRLRASGFKPNSVVDAWIFSTPRLLGTSRVTGKGELSVEFTIPGDIPNGAHRIAIEATLPDGKKATVALGVGLGDYEKESNLATWLIVVPIVAAVLSALFLPAVRKRRRKAM